MAKRNPFKEITEHHFERLELELLRSAHYIKKRQAEDVLQTMRLKHAEFLMSKDGREKHLKLAQSIGDSELELVKIGQRETHLEWKVREIINFL